MAIISASSYAQQAEIDSIQTDTETIPSAWSLSASGYYYIIPHEENKITVVGYADYKSWHMEARYNYEDLNTGSVFGGYSFETGDKIKLGATPLAGAVFGNTKGLAPGLVLELEWKKLDFYSESEYVFDFEDNENNFLYTWTELAITPFENLRTGISANRTRLFQTDLDFERGVFVQYSFWKLTAGVHYFNPFSNEYYLLGTLNIDF